MEWNPITPGLNENGVGWNEHECGVECIDGGGSVRKKIKIWGSAAFGAAVKMFQHIPVAATGGDCFL